MSGRAGQTSDIRLKEISDEGAILHGRVSPGRDGNESNARSLLERLIVRLVFCPVANAIRGIKTARGRPSSTTTATSFILTISN
jgi:hypothetical protein